MPPVSSSFCHYIVPKRTWAISRIIGAGKSVRLNPQERLLNIHFITSYITTQSILDYYESTWSVFSTGGELNQLSWLSFEPPFLHSQRSISLNARISLVAFPGCQNEVACENNVYSFSLVSLIEIFRASAELVCYAVGHEIPISRNCDRLIRNKIS